MLYRFLRQLHRYGGAAAALFLLVIAVTGGVLVFKDELLHLRHPSLNSPPPAVDPAELARVFNALDRQYGAPLRMIRLPRAGLNAYQVYLEDAQALIEPGSLHVIEQWVWHESAVGVLEELHFRLLAGDSGKRFVGLLGVLLGLMALSGVYLWWRVRRQFRWQSLWPVDMRRVSMLKFHRDLGALAAVFLLLFGLTGAGVVFGTQSRAVLNALLSPGADRPAVTMVAAEARPAAPGERTIRAAQAALPGARLISWSAPKAGSALHYFRFRMPGEPHPNGRSWVYADAGARVVARYDAAAASLGDRSAHWLYPLHAARVGGWLWRLAALATALALTGVSLAGLWSFVQTFRPARPRRRVEP